MAASAQGDQLLRFIAQVAVMNHQRRARTADPAPEAVPLQHALSQSAEKS